MSKTAVYHKSAIKILTDTLRIKHEIEQLEARIADLERQQTECSGIHYTGIRVQGSASKDQMLDALVYLDRLYGKLDALRTEYTRAARDAEALTGSLPDRHRRILHLRYIEGAHWKEIERETGYSFRHCLRLHEEALNELQK